MWTLIPLGMRLIAGKITLGSSINAIELEMPVSIVFHSRVKLTRTRDGNFFELFKKSLYPL